MSKFTQMTLIESRHGIQSRSDVYRIYFGSMDSVTVRYVLRCVHYALKSVRICLNLCTHIS